MRISGPLLCSLSKRAPDPQKNESFGSNQATNEGARMKGGKAFQDQPVSFPPSRRHVPAGEELRQGIRETNPNWSNADRKKELEAGRVHLYGEDWTQA